MHSVRLNLRRCFGLGQNAVAGVETSATTRDFQQETSSGVIVEAKVFVTERLDDAVTKRALLMDQQFRTLTFG